MPLVVVHRQNKFNEVLRRLRNNGGTGAQAYNKISQIRMGLELGVRNVCQTTDHGERRIANCVKYDLGNGYRLVTVDFGEVVMLCFAGPHDEVDHWLNTNRGHTFTYDRTTQQIAVVIEREVALTPRLPAATTPPEDQRPYLLQIEGLDWEQLVPPKSVRRQLLKLDQNTDEEHIQEVLLDVQEEASPEAANLALNMLVALRDGRLDQAERHRDIHLGNRARASEDTPITPEVVQAAANSDTLIILNDLTEAEFDALWEPSRFQEWMLYLHPGQKRVVDEDFPKPCVFTGVSGSGKTCVLVHRAIRLAKSYPGEPILILTLNRPLADLIRNHVERLAGEFKYPIRVMAFYEYLESLLKFYGLEDFLTSFGALLDIQAEVSAFIRSSNLTELTALFDAREEYEIDALWVKFCDDPNSSSAANALSRVTHYLAGHETGIDPHRYLKDELTLVRSAFRLSFNYNGYLGYTRGGRCIPFQDVRREDILHVLRTWERFQLRHGKLDGMELSQAALVALDDHNGVMPAGLRSRCVLVDEFQDFSTLDLELIGKIPSHSENGLFLTGDTAQKIYTKDFDLPSAGLAPPQRVNRSIQKNYRNSRQILEAAHLLLEAYANEATAKHEGVTVLKPEYAQRDGARPFVCESNDPLRAAWQFAGEWLAAGYPGFSVCLATANPDVISVRQIRDAAPSGIASTRLTGDYQLRTDVVVVSDIYSIKGFEFSLIVVLGMAENEFPPKGVPTGEVWREALRLYVAMTRGRDEVCLVYRGKPSPFLTAMQLAVVPRPLLFATPAPPVTRPLEPDPVPKPAAPAIPPIRLVLQPVPDETSPKRPVAPSAALPIPPVPERPPQAPISQAAGPEAPPPRPQEPESDAAMEINGVTLIPIRGDPTVRKIAVALGRPFVQIHLDFMDQAVFTAPDQTVRRAFVFKVMAKYRCAPLFKGYPEVTFLQDVGVNPKAAAAPRSTEQKPAQGLTAPQVPTIAEKLVTQPAPQSVMATQGVPLPTNKGEEPPRSTPEAAPVPVLISRTEFQRRYGQERGWGAFYERYLETGVLPTHRPPITRPPPAIPSAKPPPPETPQAVQQHKPAPALAMSVKMISHHLNMLPFKVYKTAMDVLQRKYSLERPEWTSDLRPDIVADIYRVYGVAPPAQAVVRALRQSMASRGSRNGSGQR